jgi:hypothetical protein
MQNFYHVFIGDAVIDLCPVAPAVQHSFVFHHIKLLAGNRLLAADPFDYFTDAFLAAGQQLLFPHFFRLTRPFSIPLIVPVRRILAFIISL